jgi:NH3-dependent NAD+ synthetase
MEQRLVRLVAWLREVAAPAKGLFVPVSGGSDSSLCFWICTQAFPEKTVGVFFGSHLRGRDWLEARGKVETYPPPDGTSGEQEIRRWLALLELSVARKGWLVGARNRSEDVFGTYSMASRVVGLLPLAGLWKSEVMQLCAFIGVPDDVLESSRRADPNCGRPAELAEIGLELIDVYLRVREKELPTDAMDRLTPAQVLYLDHVRGQNEFKRALPTRPPRS